MNPVLQIRRFEVKEIRWETANIYSLILAPVAGEAMFEFQPGQWVYLHLLNPDGSSLARAAFSLASAPEQSKQGFELGIKLHGLFTQSASRLMPGDVVGVQGPFGVFVPPQTPSLVLFAGGIGIAPFRSIVHSFAHQKAPTQVWLFYSNKTVEDIAYFEEFNHLLDQWSAFHPVYVLTERAPAAWQGETGRVNEAMLKRYGQHFDQAQFMMCGPLSFMDSVKSLLEKQGVDVKKRLKKELFG